MFWHGSELPLTHQVCIRSFLRHGYSVTFWRYGVGDNIPGVCYANAAEIVPQALCDSWLATANTAINHAYQTFANYFRYALIYKVGGWWVDTDFLCLRQLPESEYVFTAIADIPTRNALLDLSIPALGGNLANGLFKAPAGATFLRQILRQLTPQFENGYVPQQFGEWGTLVFTRVVHTYGLYAITPLIGNGFTNCQAIYEAANFPVPDWAAVLHLYNYKLGAVTPHPESLFSRISREMGS